MSEAGLVIVGAGHAGISAALAARAAGWAGKITMIARDGVHMPYERPPLSKWTQEGEITKPIFDAERIERAKLTLIAADVSSLDRSAKQLLLSDGRILPYHRLLLATGASARRLPLPGAETTGLHYLRDRADAESIREAAKAAKTAIVIGGGFIGLELAASLRGLGVAVHVLEMADRLLARAVSAPVAGILQELHRKQGVDFTFNARVAGLAAGAQTSVALEDGSVLTADLIIAGIGSVPNTGLAETASLEVDNGILVDSKLCTSDPNIFAAGDCCAFPLYSAAGAITRLESWQAAGQQGELAGRNMLLRAGERTACTLVPWFWSTQYDHVLQVAGIARADHTQVERPYAADHHLTFSLHEDGRLLSACGIAPGTSIAKDIRFSMKLIEAAARPSQADLAAPDITLKSLLRG